MKYRFNSELTQMLLYEVGFKLQSIHWWHLPIPLISKLKMSKTYTSLWLLLVKIQMAYMLLHKEWTIGHGLGCGMHNLKENSS